MAEAAPFLWGSGGTRLTPDQNERKRKVAEALAKQGMDYSPVQHWTQGAARVAQGLLGGIEERRADSSEKANTAESASIMAQLLGGIGGTPVAAPAPVAAGDTSAAPAASTPPAPVAAPAALLPRFAQAEVQYGLPPNFLAQTAKIESGFNPSAANPNSSARGLFQFVNGTARQYGLKDPFDPIASTDAAARLASDNKATLMRVLGREPTAGELYLAHQQGGGGASKLLANPNARAVDIVGADAVRLNGGNVNMTAGEFARLWTSKLAVNEADIPAADANVAQADTGQAGFNIPSGQVESIAGDDPVKLRADAQFYAQSNPEAARQMLARADAASAAASPAPPPAIAQASAGMTGQTFNAISGADRPLDPVFQSEGVSQPWMGTALQPQARPASPRMIAQAPMPPPRPADLPVPGAVETIGQMPMPPATVPPDLSNTNDAGARAFAVAEGEARNGQQSGMAAPSPFARVAQALTGQGGMRAAPAPAQSPAVAAVTQAIAQNPGDPIVQALTNPAASDAVKKIAMAMLVKKIEGNDTRGVTMGDRLVDPRTGRVIADFTMANGGRSTEYGLSPIYGTDKDGNPAVIQLGKRGDAKQSALPEGFKIARDPVKVDGPTGTTLLDPQTRQQIGFIPKDIAGAEGQKIEGKSTAEAKIDMPGTIAKAEQTLATVQSIRTHPGRGQFGATGMGTMLPIIGDGLPNTKGRDFVALVEQLKGKAFLEAFDSLKGGGAISEVEGAKATAAIARLDRAQTKEGFDQALKDIEDVVFAGIERAKRKAGAAPAPATKSADGWNEVAPGVRIREKR